MKYDIFFIDKITGAIIFQKLNAPFLFDKNIFKNIRKFKKLIYGDNFYQVKKFLFPQHSCIKSVLFHIYLIYKKPFKKYLFTYYFGFEIFPTLEYKFTIIDKIKILFLKQLYFFIFTYIL